MGLRIGPERDLSYHSTVTARTRDWGRRRGGGWRKVSRIEVTDI